MQRTLPFENKLRNYDVGYDILDDYSTIIDSFLYQYGIYLPRVRNNEMSFREFIHRIGGLDEKSPLVRLVQIRKETDAKIMKSWPPEMKKIHDEWQSRKLDLMSDDDFERYKEIKQARIARFLDSCITSKEEKEED